MTPCLEKLQPQAMTRKIKYTDPVVEGFASNSLRLTDCVRAENVIVRTSRKRLHAGLLCNKLRNESRGRPTQFVLLLAVRFNC